MALPLAQSGRAPSLDCPMTTVSAHYDNLLAEHYSWMFGDFDTMVARQAALLRDLGIQDGGGATAVDMGCGPGFQSIALADMGYTVIAVDTSQRLLDELKARAPDRPIDTQCRDLCTLPDRMLETARLVVCMGDTLTHLESRETVAGLFAQLGRTMPQDASVILTFRDLTVTLNGLDRFIPVRADDGTIMTCFLEYEDNHVRVHDLVYSRGENGWVLDKSAYRKLRLSGPDVAVMLENTGFAVGTHRTESGIVALRADKGA